MAVENRLDRMTVATPCTVPWATMAGDDRVRFCTQCRKNVYNVEGMTREAAEELIAQRHGELCVRFYRRVDGTVVTNDCAPRFGMIRSAARLCFCLAIFLAVLSYETVAVRADSRDPYARYDHWTRRTEPFATIMEWIDPQPKVMVMGGMCAPDK